MKHPPISRIYHQANSPAPTGADADRRNHEARKRLWLDLGVAVIDPGDIHNDWERQQVINQAEKLYGKRKGS